MRVFQCASLLFSFAALTYADQGPAKSDGKYDDSKIQWVLRQEFDAADSNKDGVLSRDEIKSRASVAFDALDANKDGFASKAEFSKAPPLFLGGSLAAKDEKAADAFVGRLFDSIDSKHEGKITKEQLRAALVAEFELMDTDKSGKLSTEEYLVFHVKRTNASGGGNGL